MNRFGIRVLTADKEIAFARIESLLADGFEEVEDGEHMTFLVYAEELTIPRFPELVSLSKTPIADGWETAWHEHLAPVTVGEITIRPPWLPGEGLVVDPGNTFGLASHPTTKLCLELLQELPPTELADWGCGCGVLSVAAKHLGFEVLDAIELDPGAVETARANGVNARVADVTDAPPWARTVVGNLTAGLLAEMGDIAAPDGRVTFLVSGVQVNHADVPMTTLAPLGFTERVRRERDGWVALILEHGA